MDLRGVAGANTGPLSEVSLYLLVPSRFFSYSAGVSSATKGIVFSADLWNEVTGTLKLLVVDHDAATLEAIAAALGPDDVRLLTADSAEAAMAMVSREQ